MRLERSTDQRLQKRLKFALRAFIVSWILAYLAVYRSETAARFLAESFFAGMHKMAVVWIVAGLFFGPLLGVYLLYQRALE